MGFKSKVWIIIKGGVMKDKQVSETRRDFLKKGAYAAPVILTLTAVPAFANSGSGKWDGDSSSGSSGSSGSSISG